MTATDEDEESGATDRCDDFYYAPKASATRFTVTTKSNGENGKFTTRKVKGEWLLFAGSKNTCLVWRSEQDITVLNPASEDGTIPGPLIAGKMQNYWRGWASDTQKEFAEQVASHGWTLMLEHNSSHHEHVFPIPQDFVEFVAILDCEGLPIPQKEAFGFFDKYKLPRVRCDEGLPISELPARLSIERNATDREGAVLYLETDNNEPVALVKVKSDFYVRARRTRQIFWNTIVDPLQRGDSMDGSAPKKGNRRAGGHGWGVAQKRCNDGMRELKHVEGNAEHWQKWAEVAVGFVKWWQLRYESASTEVERKTLIKEARDKFGSVYRDYCRDQSLPGADN